MLIFAIDDEPAMLAELHDAVAQAAPEAVIQDFSRAGEALHAVTDKGLRPDVVFSDIEMPGMDGLHLAVQIKSAVPEARIVFVTGFSQYALEAYRRHVNGYLMKPVDAEMVRGELDHLWAPARPAENGKLRIRCFGSFDVFVGDEPVIFQRTKTKELLAYLVDRDGAACTSGEIITALWEDPDEIKDPKPYLRMLTHDLRKTLAAAGVPDVLIRDHNQWALRKDLLDCDYYRMLDGDTSAENSFRGEYMEQYSWAEPTKGRLAFETAP